MASPSAARTDGAARARPGIAGWFRFSFRLIALAAALLVAVVLHFCSLMLGRASRWPRRFLAMGARIVGARVECVGAVRARDMIVIANHLSWIDILALGGATGASFIAKAEVRDTPVLGWLARQNRTLYVARENRTGVAAQVAMLREAMAGNHAIAVFPEGTTGDGRQLLPFKSSLLAMVEPSPPGVAIQPVAIDYGALATTVAWIDGEGGIDNAVRILSRRGSFTVRLHFLDPFDPAAAGGRKAIALLARERIAGALSAFA